MAMTERDHTELIAQQQALASLLSMIFASYELQRPGVLEAYRAEAKDTKGMRIPEHIEDYVAYMHEHVDKVMNMAAARAEAYKKQSGG